MTDTDGLHLSGDGIQGDVVGVVLVQQVTKVLHLSVGGDQDDDAGGHLVKIKQIELQVDSEFY